MISFSPPESIDDCLLTIFEGSLAKLSSFLLELLDCSLIDTTALVDQVTSGGGLSGIDVSDDYDGYYQRS